MARVMGVASVREHDRMPANAKNRVQYFADYRYRRARIGIKVVLSVAVAAVMLFAVLFGVGRIANVGPFAAGIPEASYDAARWNLIVVNRWHRIPDDYPQPELTTLSNGEQVDSRIYPDLQRMFDDMRAAGLNPYVTAGYRTRDKQQSLMDEKVFLYKNEGMDEKAAEEKAREWVAIPGTSEHEIGLAVDINAKGARSTADSQREHEWLAANAWQYGFILRYPNGKTDVTGNIYEPWHYRYVGAEAAKAIHDSGKVLEEYQG
ncbi:D-Ala-D-Ala carboxypeptidase VanY [Bifidobacterium goeldii]|uniref:D-Ala-D-Ala carboxypeptidase VanY n=1 Tax=Bifidobacterium goeldii TaxID=2306975 RepID=A0A430FLS9_9BIFI|nr:M15 family metallopeptidase [Bifidobacterium goeldii]RSX53701.1 D-Ala-D-Ala carboxypeptidase VanY [Bifidobacterium goeldii]